MSGLPYPQTEPVSVLPDARRDIIFRTGNYKDKFKIKDGESVKITIDYDGEELIRKCRFLNEHHLNIGGQVYHIDEFAERMTKLGHKYEPIPNQEPKLDVLIAEPGKPPRDAEIPISMAALCEQLGGEPEIISKDMFKATVKGKNGNGIIIVFGMNGENLTSLHPSDAQKRKREYVAQPKTSTLTVRLEAGKAKAAAHSRKTSSGAPRKAKGEAVV